MVALMVGTTFYQQKQMQKASSGPQAQQMRIMTTIMPVFLGFISFQIAAGVLVYWVTTNAWQIVQQYVMLRQRQEVPAGSKDGKVERPAVTKKSLEKETQQRPPNARSRKKRRKR
jgi:membrane protein insertase Oxa1/YidC/SpoIIIJ